jgi:hypothetical protein
MVIGFAIIGLGILGYFMLMKSAYNKEIDFKDIDRYAGGEMLESAFEDYKEIVIFEGISGKMNAKKYKSFYCDIRLLDTMSGAECVELSDTIVRLCEDYFQANPDYYLGTGYEISFSFYNHYSGESIEYRNCLYDEESSELAGKINTVYVHLDFCDFSDLKYLTKADKIVFDGAIGSDTEVDFLKDLSPTILRLLGKVDSEKREEINSLLLE